MKTISWNVKGLGNHKKNASIEDLLCNHCPEIVLLQETKKTKSRYQMSFICLGSSQQRMDNSTITWHNGGLLIAWKGNAYDLITTEYGTFSLSVKLQEKQQGNL